MPPKQKRQKIDHKSKGGENNGGGHSTGTPNTLQTPTDPALISQKFLDIEAEQCKELLKLQYGQGQLLVYNPLDYASQIHQDFVSKFCRGPKKVLLLGMNPGPWGMGQTGVPFGHVEYARDWLEVKGEVTKPVNEHEKRPITGLNCKRKEVSGDRMWSLLKQLSGTPEVLFTNIFLHNYCPLYFLKDSAKNVTPPELKVHERAKLEKVCDQALVHVVDLLGVEHVIGVGNYAAERARKALTNEERENIKEAFKQAKEALECSEVPVGCVFVYDGVVVAQGRNTVNATRNATRHAEMNCVDQVLDWCAEQGLDYSEVFKKVSVYVTVEPCGMCADALGQLCVDSVLYGCSNDRFGGCGSVVDVAGIYGYPIKFTKGVRAEEAVELLKDFYKGENPNAPSGKVKRKTGRD